MKNFKKDFLQSDNTFKPADLNQKIVLTTHQPQSKSFKALKSAFIRLFSPLLLSLITSPMNVGSILMQVSKKGRVMSIEEKLKVQPDKAKFITNGIYGDNIMFEPQPVKGYKSVFERMGREGVRGFYKGNLTGFLFLTSNASLRNYIFNEIAKKQNLSNLTTGIATVAICTLVDIVTYPLMTAQSRLILQNSSPSFRTYSSFIDIFKRTSMSELLKGSSLSLLKNTFMFFAWFNFFQTNPQLSFLISSILSHLVVYPFTTVMRRMQVQSSQPMMYSQKLSTIGTIKQIWSAGKIRGFYQGFLAYSIIHGATTGLMMVMGDKQSALSMN